MLTEAFLVWLKLFIIESLNCHFATELPDIFAEEREQNIYLLEDLGDQTLLNFLEANRKDDQIAEYTTSLGHPEEEISNEMSEYFIIKRQRKKEPKLPEMETPQCCARVWDRIVDGEKVKGVGFDWKNKNQVWEKVLEEIEELKLEVQKGNQDKIESEFGDVLFALTNYSRFVNVNPEEALERTNKRFIKRFQIMEEIIKKDGLILSEMTFSNMDVYWEKAKKIYQKNKKIV